MATVLPNKHYSGHCRAIEIEGNQWTPEEEIARKKYGQVQLEEDRSGSMRQSWMGRSGLWPMFHWEQKKTSNSRYCKPVFVIFRASCFYAMVDYYMSFLYVMFPVFICGGFVIFCFVSKWVSKVGLWCYVADIGAACVTVQLMLW